MHRGDGDNAGFNMIRATVISQGSSTQANLGQWEFAAIPSEGDLITLEALGRSRSLRVRAIEHRPIAYRGAVKLGALSPPATIIFVVDMAAGSDERAKDA